MLRQLDNPYGLTTGECCESDSDSSVGYFKQAFSGIFLFFCTGRRIAEQEIYIVITKVCTNPRLLFQLEVY